MGAARGGGAIPGRRAAVHWCAFGLLLLNSCWLVCMYVGCCIAARRSWCQELG